MNILHLVSPTLWISDHSETIMRVGIWEDFKSCLKFVSLVTL